MRILLLVVLFLIWEESTAPGSAHWQLIDSTLGISLFFGVYLLLLWGMRLWAGWIVRSKAGRAIDWFNRGMFASRCFVPAWFAAGVFLLGWKAVVDHLLGSAAHWPIVTHSTMIGVLPGMLAWMGLWWSQFPVDRALREQNVLYQLESDLPIFSVPNFHAYFMNNLRSQVLLTTAPLLMILALHDVGALVIAALAQTDAGRRWGATLPISDSVEQIISLIPVAVVMLLSPALLRQVLSTRRLPASELRDDLASICSSAGLRCRDILLWQTHGNMSNALVMGLIPQIRYVILSDLLLASMSDDQIRAVFAHELGHVKHRHLVWLALFFLSVGTLVLGVAGKIENQLRLNSAGQAAFDIGSLLACIGILWVGFGFLSRWFERQADVYAARTIEPPLKAQGNTDGIGAAVFASALERVALVNNIPINARNWTHGSIGARVRYIHRLGRDPKVAQRFDQTGKRVFAGLVAIIIICGGLGVYLMR